VVNKLTL